LPSDTFRVDYFSLDIEGPELEVLETIPWDKVDITAISVETEFYGEFEEKKQAIKVLLEAQGKKSGSHATWKSDGSKIQLCFTKLDVKLSKYTSLSVI